MLNESGLEPSGHAVLVIPYEPEIKKSIIQMPEDVKERSMMVEQRAIVVAIGSEAWKDEARPRAAIGDKVFITRYAGSVARGTADGKLYRLVNDRDIFCRITEEKAQ